MRERTAPARRWLRTPDARWMIAVAVLALVVRLLTTAWLTPNPRDGRFDDSLFYDTAARHMADGKGYVFDPNVWYWGDGIPVFPGETELTPTALWPPGYPMTLAAVYFFTDDSVAAGRLFNVLCGAITVALVYLIALKLFDRRAAIFAGAALALLPGHILFTSILLSETYFGMLLVLVLAISVYFVFGREKPLLAVIFALGALTAFTGYVRGEFMAFGLVLALLLAIQHRRQALLPLAALALGALLVVTPWTVRNRITMGEWLTGTTGSGRTTYQGHNPNTDGGPSLEPVNVIESPFAGLPRNEIEIRSNRLGTRLAREWALDHPVEELRLIPKRMYLLFRNDEAGVTWLHSNRPWFSAENADRIIRLATFTFYALIALSLASLPAWWRWRDLRRLVVFSIVPLYMLIFGVLFIGDPRYHYAMYFPLAIFGGYGAALLSRVTEQHWRGVFGERAAGERAFGRRTSSAAVRAYGGEAPRSPEQ